jgi:hypothetical protein
MNWILKLFFLVEFVAFWWKILWGCAGKFELFFFGFIDYRPILKPTIKLTKNFQE